MNLRAGNAYLLLAVVTGLLPAQSSGGLEEWVYLRGDVPPASTEQLVEILAVGDVMPGRGLSEAEGVFDLVADELRAADWTLGNLEGVVAAGSAQDDSIRLFLPLEAPAAIAEAGFDLLSLANNHALDDGLQGLERTAGSLSRAGIEPLASGRSLVRTIQGLSFAFIAWNDLGAPLTSDLVAAVRQAASVADNVIVTVHWGTEYQRHPALPQRELAKELLAAGADIVLGAHPHVPQDVELVESVRPDEPASLIAYSLGNFVFDQGWDDTAAGLGLRLLFDGHGLRAAQALPLWTAPRPRWIDPEDAGELLERIVPLGRIGFDCSADGCTEVHVPADTRSGRFESGEIDLTGDGIPEAVRIQEDRVEVVEHGEIAWQSPPAWRVRDLALGDPDDDGRYEMLLAVDQMDEQGRPTSHPFLVGYRGGVYRLLWGGSAVHSAILEIELADLDGDGIQELAVVEQDGADTARHVVTWRWHGWGFSLVWRSPSGLYQDLLISPTTTTEGAQLSVGLAR